MPNRSRTVDKIFSFWVEEFSEEKFSQGKKKPFTTGKEKVSPGKKKSPVERTRLTGKEIVSCQNKMCHNKTRKKLKTLVIIKTIYEVFPLRK